MLYCFKHVFLRVNEARGAKDTLEVFWSQALKMWRHYMLGYCYDLKSLVPTSLCCGLIQTPVPNSTGGYNRNTRTNVPGPESQNRATRLSPDYVPRPRLTLLASDPEEDFEMVPVDYPSDEEEEEEASEEEEATEEEEEHLAPANSIVAPVVYHVPSSEETESFETDDSAATPPSPPACHTTTRISIRPEAPMPFPSEDEVERLLALPPPPPSPLISLSPPSAEER
ncbi:hypothetical protein Tco_1390730, partial [Tanacetum coccineum]